MAQPKPPAKGGRPKKFGALLEPTEEFQPNVPRLHVNDDMRVVTINGESRGLVRKLGASMFLWSNSNGEEGRTYSEEEAFFMIGFELLVNKVGEKSLRKLGRKTALKV